MKKKICWITSACFMETDYNYAVMSGLSEIFEINWYIIKTEKQYFPESGLKHFESLSDFYIHLKAKKYRIRDPRSILFYYGLLRNVKALNPDIVYCNVAPDPSFSIMSLLFDRNKTIYAAHDGKVQNDSSSFGIMRSFSYNTIFKHSRYVNMFSKSQSDLMRLTYPQNKIHTMLLPLKDFGRSKKTQPTDIVRFLSFGNIIYQKNIDLLIEAAEVLYDRGYRNFKVSINGGCKDWEFYEQKIKHAEIFECKPQFVSNDELLDLFATSHYCVFPYRRVSQSGVLKLAFNYNTPVITSRIGAFEEEVKEDINGYFFEAENLDSLVDVMERCLKMSSEDYNQLKDKMKEYIDTNYSAERIVRYYKDLFTDFIN